MRIVYKRPNPEKGGIYRSFEVGKPAHRGKWQNLLICYKEDHDWGDRSVIWWVMLSGIHRIYTKVGRKSLLNAKET